MKQSRQERIEQHIRQDPYATLLGATLEAVEPGYSRLRLAVTDEMVNFHGMTHGGLIFSLADMAFAAAGNSRGQVAVALNVTVSFLRATTSGSTLIAEAREIQLKGPTGLYEMTVTEAGNGELVAKCQATIYRKKGYFVEPEL